MSSSLARRQPVILDVQRFAQPDDFSCGPACLVQVYRFYGHDKPLPAVIAETPRNPDGGTLVAYLGISALRNGFGATVYPFDLRVFDPTWRKLGAEGLLRKLRARRKAVAATMEIHRAIDAYITYLELGGKVRYREMEKRLLVDILQRGTPILTGLSATYLYRQAREFNEDWDDIRGYPAGHFVVVSGYYPRTDRFIVRDPSKDIPFSRTGRYSVPAERLTAAILLGDVTFDSVLLVLERPSRGLLRSAARKPRPA